MFSAHILTLYPEMFPGPLGHSLSGRALEEGIWSLEAIQIRDFATDKHKTVDATPYGGGAGLVMKADVLERAIEHAKAKAPAARLLYMSPRGVPLSQGLVHELCAQELIILCGRFEGVDQRILDHYQPLEVSAGDYVLSGGELPAMLLIDACVRLVPGVIGSEASLDQESFALEKSEAGQESGCLLEYPQYTKPPIWKDLSVPDVLLSGHHAEIARFRKAQAEAETAKRRPDLWERYEATMHKRKKKD